MEKTVLINCSPKRKLSVSGFLMKCAGILIRGKKEYLHLRTPADHQAILQALKDALHQACRVLGTSDDLTIITENLYGSYSPAVKNILDRSIATSTPFSIYRKGQMHHTLRYGKRNHLHLIVYGSLTDTEKNTWQLMAERNAVNMGFREYSITFCADAEEAGRTA